MLLPPPPLDLQRSRISHRWRQLWWSVPNNLGLLDLDLEFTCTLGWACPTMGGPRSGCWYHSWSSSLTLALNFLCFDSAIKTALQPSSLSRIQIGFPSLRNVFLLTSIVSLSPIFPTPSSYLSSPIYIFLLVRLLWWENIKLVSGSHCIISLVRGYPPPYVVMTP